MIAETIDTYLRTLTAGDRDGWLGCWRDDATMEDPVGTPVKHGIDEIAAFYDQLRGQVEHLELRALREPVIIGNEAAFAFEIVVTIGDTKLGMTAIDVMTFDDDGKIATQRAFADMTKMAPVP